MRTRITAVALADEVLVVRKPGNHGPGSRAMKALNLACLIPITCHDVDDS